MSTKRKTIEHFLQNSVHTDTKSTKKDFFPTKITKMNALVVKSLLESNCDRFRKSAIRENFNLKPETQLKKKLIPITDATTPISIQGSKREAITSFLHLCLNHI